MSSELAMQDLYEFVESRRESGFVVGGCRSQSAKLRTWLREQDVGEENVRHVQSYFDGDAGLAEHIFVMVRMAGEWVILDPTVHQFTEDNYHHQRAETYVSEAEIPEVGVITESDAVYSRYATA